MVKRLIVNADDFGLTAGTNRAIVECAETGVLTSATLMAGGAAFADASLLARQGNFAVGCHVVLVDGKPLSDTAHLATVAREGRFRNSIAQLARDALLHRIAGDEVERETLAQIRRLQDAGIQVTHVDAHKHAHMLPDILRPLLRAARSAGVKRVRNPFEPRWTMGFLESAGARRFKVALLRQLRRSFLRAVRDQRFITTDGALGVIATGRLEEAMLCRMLDRIPQGTWELVCHPGYDDADLRAQHTRLLGSRAVERRVLTSAKVREAVERNGIELISFAEL
ncbi:MAG: ChbG/HpnK family deacetylase [Acidobacteriaceae bacterium]